MQENLCNQKFFRSPLKLWLSPCNHSDTEQKWYFTNYEEEGIPAIEEEEETDHDEL
jgi:hypothetical protein